MRFFFILLLVISNNVFAQSYRKSLEANANKVTIVYVDHTITAFTTSGKGDFFPETDKLYYWYSANQIKATQGGYSGKLLDGLYKDYYLTKNLKEQGEFKKGLKKGEWITWYENGNLKERSNWISGYKNGKFFKYDTTGTLTQTGKYRKGLLHGKITTYKGGDSTEVKYYKNNAPSSQEGFTDFLKNLFTFKRKTATNKLAPQKSKTEKKDEGLYQDF